MRAPSDDWARWRWDPVDRRWETYPDYLFALAGDGLRTTELDGTEWDTEPDLSGRLFMGHKVLTAFGRMQMPTIYKRVNDGYAAVVKVTRRPVVWDPISGRWQEPVPRYPVPPPPPHKTPGNDVPAGYPPGCRHRLAMVDYALSKGDLTPSQASAEKLRVIQAYTAT